VDGKRFDAFTRTVATGLTRRRVLGALSGVFAGVLAAPAAAATARPAGAICRKNGDCASGVCLPKDATGRQRCQAGIGDPCSIDTDCATSLCVNGICCSGADFCEGNCCSPDRAATETCCPGTGQCCECFRRTDPGNERIECCQPDKLCRSLTNSPAADNCCHSDEVCVNGSCCWVGRACEDTCCQTPCCNGVCCASGEECAIAPGESVASCQAVRSCTADSDCNTAVGEACREFDGVCCPSERWTSVETEIDGVPTILEMCCPYGEGEAVFGGPICCPEPDRCGTSRGKFGRF
jgi:hypothetical protein